MSELARSLAAALHTRPWSAIARPAQLPPVGNWRHWLLLGGRGSGKTRAAAEYVTAEVMAGRARHVAVVGRTAADVRDVMIEGPSGLLTIAPGWFRPSYEPSKRRLTWPNGAAATAFSADEPDLLRGPQQDLAWCDELAAWDRAQETWDTLLLGLRLGQARCVVSTTPKPIPLVRDLLARDRRGVAVTTMTTFENLPNLSPAFAADIVTRYAGTHLGRQELYAELLLDTPGALWTRDLIERTRLRLAPLLVRVVVGVDPSVAALSEGTAECGIVVAGVDRQQPPHAYVLEDASLRASPDAWARRAVAAYRGHQADRIVAEGNQGGELVRRVLQTVDRNLPIKIVNAARSKQARAEPIAALYEQSRVHHIGLFADLEEQMCSWTPGRGESPDRLDALVWSVWALVLEPIGIAWAM